MNIRDFVEWKCMICANSDLPITYWVCEKGWFKINGPPKMLFITFCLFPLPKFLDYCQKPYSWFWGFLVISTMSQIFLTYTFFKMKWRPFYFFFSFPGYAIWFFIFSKWKKHDNLPLMTHLKCTVANYTNLKWSSKNKPFLNYGSLNMLFRFFQFLIYVYFNEAFVKIFMK